MQVEFKIRFKTKAFYTSTMFAGVTLMNRTNAFRRLFFLQKIKEK